MIFRGSTHLNKIHKNKKLANFRKLYYFLNKIQKKKVHHKFKYRKIFKIQIQIMIK